MLVADAIRREYYYDESAGVPSCLDKAVKAADRRLRGSREAAGTLPGAIGVAIAVARNNELYLATIGAVEAYLVRSARLLVPERADAPGLPSDSTVALDVWRGELSTGDALLLVSQNMTRTVGTEELKSAILTLHPQAAVEHLHHLFVTAGGSGSDGVMALETTELATQAAGRAVPAAAGQTFGDLPGMLPEPVGGAVGQSLVGARTAVGASLSSVVDRVWDAMPRRNASVTRVRSRTSKAETRRRIAIGLMAMIGVVFLLGTLVIVLPREGDTTQSERIAVGDSSLTEARDLTVRAENLYATQPEQALNLYREAWSQIRGAQATGLSDPALAELETRARAGLDQAYGTRAPVTSEVTLFKRGVDPIALVRGPDRQGAAYYLDRETSSIVRVAMDRGATAEVVTQGDRAAGGGKARLGKPVQIEQAPTEVVIVDDDRQAWRWRPSDGKGNGTLARLGFQGNQQWGTDHGDIATFPDPRGYRIYVAEPSQEMILRYEPTFDQSSFGEGNNYLVSTNEAVAEIEQIYIDRDVYTLSDDGLLRYVSGRFVGTFSIGDPPDADDLRPGADYTIVTGTGNADDGTFYLYDSAWGRIVAFSKVDGSYRGQWVPGPDDPSMDDVRGMYVIPGKKKRDPDRLVWVSPEGVFQSNLTTAATEAAPPPDTKKKKRKNAN